MDDVNYKIDKNAVALHNQSIALDRLEKIESECNLTPIAFLKNNFKNVKIRQRKNEPNFRTLLSVCWSKISLLAGIKTNIDGLNAEDISRMIFSNYSDFSIEEIYKAFELERYGAYEEKTNHFQLFNAEYISAVLKKYRIWKKQKMMEQNINAATSTKTELTDSEKEKIIIEGIELVYAEFKGTKIINEPCEYIFDFLVEKRKIKNSNHPNVVAYFETKRKEAQEELKKELGAEKPESKSDRITQKINLERIIGGQSGKIIIRAKKNILKEYFLKQSLLKKEKIFT